MRGFLKSVLGLAALLVKFTTLHASAWEHEHSTTYTSVKGLPYEGSKNKGHRKAKLVRGPYLQMVSGEGATLRWRTDIPTDSKVEAGTAFGQYTQATTDTALTTEHEVRVQGLKADTRYYYRVGSSTQVLQRGKENYFTTAPPPNTTRRIGVAVFGDCGTNDKLNRTFSLGAYRQHTKNNPAELMLLLGDNAYSDGLDQEYQKKFFRPFGRNLLKNHALFPAPGNHEYANDPERQKDHNIAYYSIFSVPQAGECGGLPSGSKSYYSYNWGNIHFVSLDSYGEHDAGTTRLYDTLGAQVQWLKKDLSANRQLWTVVYWHHPPYTMGSHNSDTETELIRIRENFLRVLERYGVDLVISGHSHNYERSYLLNGYYGREASFSPEAHALSTSTGGWDGSANSCPYTTGSPGPNRGTVYVVAGSSGASGHVEDSYPHNALPFAHNTGGMFYFEVEGNRLDARFLRKNGTIGDRFSMVKDVAPVHQLVVSPGDSAVLTAGWSGDHRWSNGSNARSITVAPLQDSTYRVEDPKGCLSQMFHISVKPVGTKAVAPGK
jgi:acid phosphatase type 7